MVLAFAVTFWQSMPVKNAQAADNSLTSITMKDTDGNGEIDRMIVLVDNDSVSAAKIWGNSGWSATDGGVDVSLFGAVQFDTDADDVGDSATSNSDPLKIIVNLDQSDADLTLDTANSDLELIYTQALDVDAGTEYNDAGDVQLVAISTGDVGALAEVDAAVPVYVSSKTLNNLANGTIEIIKITYSESILDSSVAASDYKAFIDIDDLGSLNEYFSSLSPAYGIEVGVANDPYIYVGVSSGTETILTNKTDYTINIAQISSITDLVSNSLSSFATQTSSDGARPFFVSAVYSDSQTSGTGYGEVDTITLVFSENIFFTYSAADWAFSRAGDVNLTGDFEIVDCTGSGTTTIVCTDTNNSSMISGTNKTGIQTAVGTEPLWGYINNSNNISDGTNHMGDYYRVVVDGAAPMLVSSTPTAGYAGYSRTGNIELTFSEMMEDTGGTAVNSTNVTSSPTWGTPIVSSDVNDVVWTFDPSVTFASHTSYTITISSSIKDNSAAANAIGTTVLTFTSASGGGSVSGGSSVVTSTTPVVTLTSPDGGEFLTGGDVQNVTWTTSGSGMDTVGIYYSADNGSTYNLVAYNLNKSLGTYEWTLPNIDSETVLVKIIAYDSGKGNLDSDVSTAFLITASSETVVEAETPAEDVLATDDEGRTVGTDSGLTGPSPVTGEDEVISTVAAGEFIRGYSFNTIYYIDENNERRPFLDTNSFFTYADSFDEVVWVTDATLPTMDLGAPMLPAPGVVLIKIQSDPKVYAIDTGDVLRWIPTEEVATSLYGITWADYIIDLEPTTFARFSVGDDMTIGDSVNLDIMKTRMELAEATQ